MARATTSNGTVDGTVFYDGECSICTRGARRFESVLARRRIALAPLQTPDACARLGIAEEDRLKEMRLRLTDGIVFGGPSAVAELARKICGPGRCGRSAVYPARYGSCAPRMTGLRVTADARTACAESIGAPAVGSPPLCR